MNRWGPPVGLLAIWLTMAVLNPRFLSAVNLTNLTLQIVAVGSIAVGIVLVLLIREIDLSVGAVSGLGAGVAAVLSVKHGWPAGAAIGAALAVGAGTGVLHGLLVTKVGVPSFVVTLAGLLTWQGALAVVLGETGTVNLADPALAAIAGTFLSPAAGWTIAALVAALAGLVVGRRLRWPREAGARGAASWIIAATATTAAVAVFNADRGTPLVVVLFLLLLVAFDLLTRRTRLGRHALAVGSSPDAARRAGIDVDRVRVLVFTMTAVLAVTGGVIAASRLLAVNQSSGSTDLMLFAIAAAVIGGTSLFGGRGSVWSALVGSLVVGSLGNGLDLLGASSAIRSIAIGLVLAAAVGFDAVSRRRADATRGSPARSMSRA